MIGLGSDVHIIIKHIVDRFGVDPFDGQHRSPSQFLVECQVHTEYLRELIVFGKEVHLAAIRRIFLIKIRSFVLLVPLALKGDIVTPGVPYVNTSDGHTIVGVRATRPYQRHTAGEDPQAATHLERLIIQHIPVETHTGRPQQFPFGHLSGTGTQHIPAGLLENTHCGVVEMNILPGILQENRHIYTQTGCQLEGIADLYLILGIQPPLQHAEIGSSLRTVTRDIVHQRITPVILVSRSYPGRIGKTAAIYSHEILQRAVPVLTVILTHKKVVSMGILNIEPEGKSVFPFVEIEIIRDGQHVLVQLVGCRVRLRAKIDRGAAVIDPYGGEVLPQRIPVVPYICKTQDQIVGIMIKVALQFQRGGIGLAGKVLAVVHETQCIGTGSGNFLGLQISV